VASAVRARGRSPGRYAELLAAASSLAALVRRHGDRRLHPFRQSGLSRARHARLVWEGAVGIESLYPVQAIAVADLPEAYGAAASSLQFTLDVIIRASAYLAAISPPETALNNGRAYRLPVLTLYSTLGALLATLTDRAVVTALAGMAGIDPVIMPLPANLDFVTGPAVSDLLQTDGLVQIRGAGPFHGANLLTNRHPGPCEARRPDDPVRRRLQQIALDAGISGMETLLAAYDEAPARTSGEWMPCEPERGDLGGDARALIALAELREPDPRSMMWIVGGAGAPEDVADYHKRVMAQLDVPASYPRPSERASTVSVRSTGRGSFATTCIPSLGIRPGSSLSWCSRSGSSSSTAARSCSLTSRAIRRP
jgi:hypothetical protein